MSAGTTAKPLYDDIDLHLLALLQQVRDIIVRLNDNDLAKYDTSDIRFAVIFVISALGHDATPGEIARWTLHRPHTISTLIDRMEKDGLVRRVRDLKRKSMVRIELTPKGRNVHIKISHLKPIHKIMSALSEEERLQLKALLFKLRVAVCKAAKVGIPLFPPAEIR